MLYKLYLRYRIWEINRRITKITNTIIKGEAAILRLEKLESKDDRVLRLKAHLEAVLNKLRGAILTLTAQKTLAMAALIS